MPSSDTTASFGYWIKRQRQALGLTQALLARQVGCATVTIQKLELDERRPSRPMAERLADCLAIPSDRRERFLQSALGIKTPDGLPVTTQPLHSPQLLLPQVLPKQITPFVGRNNELAHLTQLLVDPGVRLITIVGSGGIGKTRLALAAVEHQLSASVSRPFSHGLYFVPLASISTPEQIVVAIATVLNLRLDGQLAEHHYSNQQQLQDYLREKALLLVLDNFEHVVAGAPILSELLHQASSLKILATSRERLNLQEEYIFPIEGLSVPSSSTYRAKRTVDEQADAVTLFVQQAVRVQPNFQLSDENYAEVIRICRFVDGMPLAIELAATWVSLLSLTAIVTEIQQNLGFLVSRLRNVPERHRSVRAVFEPSWQRLNPSGQSVFAKLSLFRNGFTFASAQAVTGCDWALLAHLHHQSLIRYQPHSSRYEIHELLRQYGAEQLEQNEAWADTARRLYSVYFCTRLAQLGSELKTSEQTGALRTVEIEHENLHVAWLWAVRNNMVDLADQALEGLLLTDEWRGRYAEGERICALAIVELATQTLATTRHLQAKLLTWQGIFVRYQGEPERADQLLNNSLHLFAELQLTGADVRAGQAFLWLRMGKLAERMDREKALGYFKQSLTLYQTLKDAWGTAYALEALGFMALEGQNFAEASAYYSESLRLFQHLGDDRGSLYILNQLVISLAFENKLAEANTYAYEAEQIVAKNNEPALVAYTLARKAIVTWFLGKIEDVHSYYSRSLAIYEELGDRHTLPNAHLLLAEVLTHLGRVEECQSHIQKALRFIRRTGDHFYLAWALMLSGMLAVFTKDYGRAEQQLHESIEVFMRSGQSRRISECLSTLALIALHVNEQPRARSHLSKALGLLKDTRYLPSVLLALAGVGCYLAQGGELIAALELDALVSRYPLLNGSLWVDTVITQPLRAATLTLPSDVVAVAQARGQTLDPWDIAMQLFEQFSSSSA